MNDKLNKLKDGHINNEFYKQAAQNVVMILVTFRHICTIVKNNKRDNLSQ